MLSDERPEGPAQADQSPHTAERNQTGWGEQQTGSEAIADRWVIRTFGLHAYFADRLNGSISGSEIEIPSCRSDCHMSTQSLRAAFPFVPEVCKFFRRKTRSHRKKQGSLNTVLRTASGESKSGSTFDSKAFPCTACTG